MLRRDDLGRTTSCHGGRGLSRTLRTSTGCRKADLCVGGLLWCAAIAARLGRAPSTISREVRRNTLAHDGGVYDGDLAHARTQQRL
ncbi:helix-turn-helix domain-containing protein [Streptomyces chartreusis]|uniref:helix-turn-helix domain-containing protein n=1 Tax=Streptomyces chartreusis TaxID=1969 RepID=UPI003673F87D